MSDGVDHAAADARDSGSGSAAGDVTALHQPSLVAHVTQLDHDAGLAAAVERAVAPFGGWAALVKPGERIAVKINLLRAAPPESAVCTHPETLRCVLRALKAAGAQPFVGDSPGGPGTRGFVMRAYKVSGIAAVCAEEQVEVVWVDEHVDTLAAPAARLYRSFPVGRPWIEADGIIQVGILKTHGLMRLTGGTKLTFGCVSGLSKPQLHVRSQRRDEFADMLIDLHLALAPRFTIFDGIVAMEGKGPGSGKPRKLGSLFAARDAIALDVALADRTAHRRHEIYVLTAAQRRGLVDLERPYELTGDDIVAEHDFVPAKWDADVLGVGPLTWFNTPRLNRMVRSLITARPRLVDEPACTRCGNCAEICGADAITLAPTPLFDESRCVRCFCCTEVCPTAAIVEVSPSLAKVVGKISRR